MKEKRDCKIVQDLLPNYVEKLTDEETNKYIEEHLDECTECKKILENIQKDLEINSAKREEREIKYIKKYSNKMRVLKIILLVILAIFLITTGRKMIIIASMSKKANKYINSNNYHQASTAYDGNSLVKIDVYYKDGKRATFLKSITEFGTRKISAYNNGEKTNTYFESGDKKIVQFDNTVGLEVHMFNYFETSNIIEFIASSIMTNIKSTECNGKECYLVTNFMSSSILTGIDEGTYIEKETGLVVRNSGGRFTDPETGIVTDNVHDITYEFDNVSDDIFIEPDISEYTISE